MVDPSRVPVFVLCGGLGTRLKEVTELLPKPMVPIGNRPVLWHIMRTYAQHGFRKFVLCLGYKAEVIKAYFLNYTSMNSDFTVDLKTNSVTMEAVNHTQDWQITLADTGEMTMTGARVARAAERYLGNAEHFAVTYGDGVTNVDLRAELMFHATHGRCGTVLGVSPPSRFGQILPSGDVVARFEEKPQFTDQWINGGYFFFRPAFLPYLSQDESCVLERAPLIELARDRQLAIFRHRGFWACLDTQRDLEYLNRVWATGDAPWATTAPKRSHADAHDLEGSQVP